VRRAGRLDGEHVARQGDAAPGIPRAWTDLSSGVLMSSTTSTPAARPDAARRGHKGGPRGHARC